MEATHSVSVNVRGPMALTCECLAVTFDTDKTGSRGLMGSCL